MSREKVLPTVLVFHKQLTINLNNHFRELKYRTVMHYRVFPFCIINTHTHTH